MVLPQPLVLGLRWGSTSAASASAGPGSLTCEVAAGGVGVARASIALLASPALWPLWTDAVIVSTTGLTRSAVLGRTANATGAVLAAACRPGPDSAGRPSCSGSVAVALTDPRAVLAAVRATWASSPLPSSNATLPPFTLTLVGQALVVLRAPQRAFGNGTAAAVGAAPAPALASSSDGEWILLSTPSQADICGSGSGSSSGSGECGYRTLALSNAPAPPVACPPFCPGSLPPAAFPLVVNSSGTLEAVPAEADPSSGAPLPVALPALSSLGIYYARACAATGLWTDPSTGACANGSDPASLLCAYGSGDGCVTCPGNALCPGGARA